MVVKTGKNPGMAIILIYIAALLILTCAPTVYSPHAQNEMITPYNVLGEKHEFGGAFAYNKWITDQFEHVEYIKTYPSASFSLLYNTSYALHRLGWIGGVELIGAPLKWTDPNISGSALYFKPYLGLQFNGSIITLRLSSSPLILGIILGNGKWITGGDFAEFTLYQLTFLLHNPQPAIHTIYGGMRFAPKSIGYVGGYEFALTKSMLFRTEYSYLVPKLFESLTSESEGEVKGSVHYITFGIFTRIK